MNLSYLKWLAIQYGRPTGSSGSFAAILRHLRQLVRIANAASKFCAGEQMPDGPARVFQEELSAMLRDLEAIP